MTNKNTCDKSWLIYEWSMANLEVLGSSVVIYIYLATTCVWFATTYFVYRLK